MKTSSLFQPRAALEIDRLVAEHPLAQLVSSGHGQLVCTPLPLLLERAANGEPWLVGHFARANPQVNLLRQQSRALAIFMGAHGYISPSWIGDRTQAPTWNYETVHFELDVTFDENVVATDNALARLVSHMEQDRPHAWSVADMGPRYAGLAAAVVAFRARVIAIHAKFKLGQNERPDVYVDILRGLEQDGQRDLIEAMHRAERRAVA